MTLYMVCVGLSHFTSFKNLEHCGGVRKFLSSTFKRSINVISLHALHYTHHHHQHFYGRNAMLKTTAQCFIVCTQRQCPYIHIHFFCREHTNTNIRKMFPFLFLLLLDVLKLSIIFLIPHNSLISMIIAFEF